MSRTASWSTTGTSSGPTSRVCCATRLKCKDATPAARCSILCTRWRFPDRDIQGDSVFERGLLGIGDRLGLLAGVVLAVSAFTGWYAGPGEGVKVSVTGWDTGVGGKVVFFLGVAVVLVVVLREVGVELPAAVPESLLTIALGAVATIIVLVRVISIPDDFFFAGRGRRDLDQPRGRDRRDRGRAAAGIRRALTRPSRQGAVVAGCCGSGSSVRT